MAQTVSISGLRELERALGELGKRTGKSVLRRVGKKALGTFVSDAARRAPERTGELKESIAVSTRLSRRQKARQRKLVAEGKAAVELYGGAEALPHAHLQEFGTVHHAPQPFMRPAWDATKRDMLNGIEKDLWREIEKTARRQAQRQARLLAKGK